MPLVLGFSEGATVSLILGGMSLASAIMVALIARWPFGKRATPAAATATAIDRAESAWINLNRNLQQKVDRCERRERRTLAALEWAYDRIGVLENTMGIPPTTPPPLLDPDDEDFGTEEDGGD